ncbi:SDR family oxidoreductase [Halomonas sp. McH1-25]|uniref:SDR family oxidoreductase n=1 Tax=unclassified Halomonas TaxID=2609666 RepID=UPI001EF641E8|nr:MULTISPECIES: SDR family oxidoreductase [unclassified Halomonas]MCG7599922.1 SDR family oxidoreductase [Halomonas sp. McH1-25]MCP1342613.1 SDR family oxidoreductase [Halomonas sp. FL8]MCP1361328.1 SDR family oxidoreductase [Halomonas sp. BBD45]MCP1364915.1 SDR family oxidoreductase [Halomonas sp. BBD48]
MPLMRILLVGGSGFIGWHLLTALVAEGHQVVATSRSGRGPELPGVSWQSLDLGKLGDAGQDFTWPVDVALVINTAGLLTSDANALEAVQDRGSRALFDLAARHDARILQFSALGAGEHAQVPFLASKAVADDYLLGLDVSAVVLRPSMVIGRGGGSSGWLTQLSPLPLIPLLDTRSRVQAVHIDDLVAAVLALLRQWPAHPSVLPLVGPRPMTLPQMIDTLRGVQGWAPARYVQVPRLLASTGARLGDRLGWRALNTQTLRLSRHDNLASPEALAEVCGFRAAPVRARLHDWPTRGESVTATLRPVMLAVLVAIWLGTALVCLGPGYDWGLRIMAQAGVEGGFAATAVISGALLDAILGLGLLWRRWRRHALRAQIGLMLAYMLIITVVVPHYWFDPFAAVGKNAVLIVATLWLLWTEPGHKEASSR